MLRNVGIGHEMGIVGCIEHSGRAVDRIISEVYRSCGLRDLSGIRDPEACRDELHRIREDLGDAGRYVAHVGRRKSHEIIQQCFEIGVVEYIVGDAGGIISDDADHKFTFRYAALEVFSEVHIPHYILAVEGVSVVLYA